MHYSENKIGSIEVICGPMFAGKTEELIRRCKRMEFAKKNFLIFKPSIDDRYSLNEVVSHNKRTLKAINIDPKNPIEMEKYIREFTQAIVVDEIQFFDESVIDILTKYAKRGLRIICAGLDLDFKGKPFGLMPEILALADSVTKLTAICVVCGEEATRTQRIVNGIPAYEDEDIVKVGAKESYEPRCLKCHEVLKREE